jgi:hypothetical protein
MNVKEWAEKLNGCEYRQEVTRNDCDQLKSDGVIIACGASDDLLDFSGALYDEIGAWDGVEVRISSREKGSAFIFDENENRYTAEFNKSQIKNMQTIKAIWSPKDIEASWKIETKIPHETFDIMEDGELYCRGIAFHVDSIKRVWD